MNNYILINKLSDGFNDDSACPMLIAVDGIRYVLRVCKGMSKIKVDGFDGEFYIKESPEIVKDLIYADSNSLKVGF